MVLPNSPIKIGHEVPESGYDQTYKLTDKQGLHLHIYFFNNLFVVKYFFHQIDV